jgi:hypothetical protein
MKQPMERFMKTSDKQRPEQKGKDRVTMRKHKGEQQQSEQQDSLQQGGWGSAPEKPKDMGRKPPVERDRDYDPDGDRPGRAVERP